MPRRLPMSRPKAMEMRLRELWWKNVNADLRRMYYILVTILGTLTTLAQDR